MLVEDTLCGRNARVFHRDPMRHGPSRIGILLLDQLDKSKIGSIVATTTTTIDDMSV